MQRVEATVLCGAWAPHCSGVFCCRTCTLEHSEFSSCSAGLSCSTACRIFPDQGLNPCPLHCQGDSYPLYHQEALLSHIFKAPQILLKCSQGWNPTSSVQFSHSVVSDSLQPHGLQHASLPCPSPTPRACSISCPSSR